jgi:circadian clock protein KaiB
MTEKSPAHKRGSAAGKAFFRMRLFVAGNDPNSTKAMASLSRIAEQYLKGRCEIIVVDVLQDYLAALNYQVVAVPTLIVESPPPQRVIVGSLSEEDKVLAVLGIVQEGGRP